MSLREVAKYLLMMSSLLILGACGVGDEVKPKSKTSFYLGRTTLFQEGVCEGKVEPKMSDLLKKALELNEHALSFTHLYNRHHFPYVQAPGSVVSLALLSTSPLRPMILNEEILKKDLDEASRLWKELLGEDNVRMAQTRGIIQEVQPQVIDRLEKLNEAHQMISTLKEKVQRFEAHQCNLKGLAENSSFDLRAMYQHKKDLQDAENYHDPRVRSSLLNLCEDYQTRGLCLSEKHLHEMRGTLRGMSTFYLNLSNEREKVFYQHKPRLKFQCMRDAEKVVMIVPIITNELLLDKLNGSLQSLKETVADKWSNNNFRVVLQEVDPIDPLANQALKIEWNTLSLSFVKKEDPSVIHLADNLNFSQLNLTFSHEIGHVFGFQDCYHEFYDVKEKSIIYYSLDESGENLMCNLNFKAKAPESYINKLESGLCRF